MKLTPQQIEYLEALVMDMTWPEREACAYERTVPIQVRAWAFEDCYPTEAEAVLAALPEYCHGLLDDAWASSQALGEAYNPSSPMEQEIRSLKGM